MSDENVEVLIDVRQSGLDNARAVRQELENIGHTAGETGATSKIDRLRGAFERWESREPTRFIRGTTVALESMAFQAIGTEGPVGRLAANFALLGTGGAAGLALIGGLGAAATAFKLLNAESAAANEQITKAIAAVEKLAALPQGAQTRLTLMGGRAALGELEGLQGWGLRNRELSLWDRISTPTRDVETVASEYRNAEAKTAELAQNRAVIAAQEVLNQKERERVKVISEELLAVQRASLALDHLFRGTHASAEEAERFAVQADRLALMTSKLTSGEQELEISRRAGVRAVQQNLADEEAFRGTPFGRRYTEATGPRPFVAPTMAPMRPEARGLPGPGFARGVDDDAALFPDPMFLGVGDAVRRALIAEHPVSPGAAPSDRSPWLRAGMELPRLLADLHSGGGGRVIGDVGGIVDRLAAGAKEGSPLAALGPVGLGVSLVGSLVSLFSGGQHKVSVAALDAQALQQLKDLGASIMPPNFSIVEVGGGGSSRDAAYQLGRRTRLDQNPRLPYSVG